MKNKKRVFKKIFKILKKSVSRFFQNQDVLISNGLALKTIITFIPLTVLMAGVIKFFFPAQGLKEKIINFLRDFIFPSSLDNISSWVSATLESSGKIGLLSVILLFYLGIDLFLTLDIHIERIWASVSTKRIMEKILKYWMLLTVAPFILAGYFYYSGFIKTVLEILPFRDISNLENIFYNLISFLILTLFIFIIYYVIPSAKVHFLKALCTSVFVVFVCYIFKVLFVYFAGIFFTRSHLIYGAFAALIIFIFWTSLNWMTIIFGHEFLYVWQNKLYKEHIRFGKTFLFDLGFILLILKEIYDDFKNKSKGLSALKISEKMTFDVDEVKKVLNIFTLEGVIISDNKAEPQYFIKKDFTKLKLSFLEELVWKKIVPVEYQNSLELKKICLLLGNNYINEKNSSKVSLCKFF